MKKTIFKLRAAAWCYRMAAVTELLVGLACLANWVEGLGMGMLGLAGCVACWAGGWACALVADARDRKVKRIRRRAAARVEGHVTIYDVSEQKGA